MLKTDAPLTPNEDVFQRFLRKTLFVIGSLQDTVQVHCKGSQEGGKDHHGQGQPGHPEEEWAGQ